MQEDDPYLLKVDVAEAACAGTDIVVQFCNRFDTGKPSSCHHERQHRAAELRVRFDISLFESMDDVITQHQGVTKIPEGQGVFLNPRLADKTRDVAERDHKMVVFELVRPWLEA